VEKRLEKEKAQVSRFERFKAVITNKDVKTTVKNVGKGYKAVTDSVSKTFDTTSSTAKGFGQSGVVVGGVTQIFETVVDVYLIKQKVDKAKRDLGTVEKGDVQIEKERALEKDIAEKLKETNKAKSQLRTSERRLKSHKDHVGVKHGELGDKEKEVEKIEGQLRGLEENLRSTSHNPSGISTGFLDQVQRRLTKDLIAAETALAKLDLDKETQVNVHLDEIEKIEGQLQALDENILDAPQLNTGIGFYKQEQARLLDKLSTAQTALTKVDEDMDGQISAKQDEITKLEGKLRGVDDNLRALAPKQQTTTGTSFFMEERDRLKGDLSTAKSEVQQLKKEIRGLEKHGKTLEKKVAIRKETLKETRKELKALRTELGESLSKDKLKTRMAEKDLNQYNDDVPLERAKLMKSLLDGTNATIGITGVAVSGASTVVQEGVKLSGGFIGVVAGPVTIGVNTKDMVNDIKGNRTALALKHKASDALAQKDGIKQDDGELLAIAERLRLKQKKNSVDKGLSATKNAFGALGGVGTAASGAAAIAVVVGGTAAAATAAAAILTPVGWALAGGAAAAAIGYGAYKLARHVNSSAIKEALRETIQLTNNQPGDAKLSELNLSKKEAKALDKVATKLVKALEAEGIHKEKGDLTVDELNNYACKKLLARDTSTATEALLTRFKEEVKAHLGDNPPTKEALEQYIKTESLKVPIDSAVGLMSKLGVGLKGEEALDLYRDKSQSDGIKFLTKKVYSPTKEAPTQEKSVTQGIQEGPKVEKGGIKGREDRLDSPRDSISVPREDPSPSLERTPSVRDVVSGNGKGNGKKEKLDLEESVEHDHSTTRSSYKSGKSPEGHGSEERGVLKKSKLK
jgi:predicted  nucleic acid-binding Zn-ribbon protein